MTTPNGSFAVRDEATIRDSILRTVSNLFAKFGLPAPNVQPESEMYLRATAYARQLTVTESNGVVSVDNQMPDTALGTYLGRWLAIAGMTQRGSGGSAGNVTITCTQNSPVPSGAQLQDAAGLRYVVALPGVYQNTQQLPIVAVDGGVATNHKNGDVLSWVIPPPFCGKTVAVGLPGAEDGLVGGVDAEDAENARDRMLVRFANPMGGGNWASLALLGAAASPVVMAAFVYPAAAGPGTVHVCVVGYASTLAASNARNRDLSFAVMNGTVIPFVKGNISEAVEIVVTTAVNQPVDVSLGLALPSSPAASPPGPGGGWLDGQPWPYNSTGASNFRCQVTAVTNSSSFVVDAPTAPIPGVSRVAWIDPTTWKLNKATVLTSSGTAGAYAVTVDTPWPNLPAWFVASGTAYVFPQSSNQDTYVAAILAAFAGMGPGEKTAAAGLLSRAARKPLPSSQFPYALGNQQLQVVTDSDPVVAATQWLYRSASSPSLPVAIVDPPKILTPRQIAFYPI